MRKSFVQAVSRRSSITASRLKASVATTCDALGEAALPPWVSKHEPHASEKSKPEFGSRQKKCEETNCALAPPSQSAKLLNVAEAAWILNVSEKTVRRMIEAGNLAVIRIGRSIRINPEVIEKIMHHNE